MCQSLTTIAEPDIFPPFLLEEPRICKSCRGSSLNSYATRLCDRCGKRYCTHYSSKVDSIYCQYCFHDFVFEDTIITKEIKSKSLSGRKTFTRTMKARHLVFRGEAWMFAQQRVLDMSEEELVASIEYHREIFSQMMDERDARQIQKNRLALKRMVRTSGDLNNPSRSDIAGIIGLKSATIKTTKVTKTRIVAQGGANPMLAMQAVINMLKSKGLSEDQIKIALSAMVGKSS